MQCSPLDETLISFWYRLLQHNKKELGRALASLSDRYARFVEELLTSSAQNDTIHILATHCSTLHVSQKKCTQLVRDKGLSYCLRVTIDRLYRKKHPPQPPSLLQILQQELAIAQRFGDAQSECFYQCMLQLEELATSDDRMKSCLSFCRNWFTYCEEYGTQFPFALNQRIEYPKSNLLSIAEEISQCAALPDSLTLWQETVLSKEFLCATTEKQKKILEEKCA